MVAINAQNIPADLKVVRRAFVPKRPGWVLSDFDYSKIEPRLTAYFASLKGDDTLARYLREGRDPYRAVVAGIYGKREDELTEREYKDGKILYLSLMYGGGVRTIQEQFGVDRAEAKRMISKFHSAWPIVRVMQDDVVRIARKRGYIRTPWGRHLHMEEFGEHKLFNKLIQGSAAHMMKRTLIKVAGWLREHPEIESHPILTIHDSINFDGPAAEVEVLHENIPALMDDSLISAVVPIRVDHEVSPANWSEKLDYYEWRDAVATGTG